MPLRVACVTNRNKMRVAVIDSAGRNIANWNSVAHNVGHMSTEWLARQCREMHKGHQKVRQTKSN